MVGEFIFSIMFGSALIAMGFVAKTFISRMEKEGKK